MASARPNGVVLGLSDEEAHDLFVHLCNTSTSEDDNLTNICVALEGMVGN